MIRIPRPSLAALLDHVQIHLQGWARGRAGLAPRVYAADADGVVTVLGFPMPADDAGRAALGAALEAEMQQRQAVAVVLAMPGRAGPMPGGAGQEMPGGAGQEVLVLEARALAGAPGGAGRATQLLGVERRHDGRIARLAPLTGEPAGAEAGPVSAAGPRSA